MAIQKPNPPKAIKRAEASATYAAMLSLANSLTRAQVNQWWRAFALNTFNHYRWARAHIRCWAKSRAQCHFSGQGELNP